MARAVDELREWLAEVSDLDNATQLLEWDQQTMMPARGAGGRAEALATLHRVSHEKFVSAETGSLLDGAQAALNGAPPESDDASLVRVSRRRWEKARRVPTELAADQARAASLGQEAWVKARAESDFASFAPYLERNLELARRYVDCFDDFDCPYDVLLDDYEPGMKTAEVARLFAELKSELVPLIATLAELSDRVDSSWLHDRVPVDRQRQLVTEVVQRMGFDPTGWRIDTAVHPFATSFGSTDVRITTRWDETYFPMALFGAMHECGHGLYEAGIADSLQRTPLGHAESLGLHESQSRMWENMVGRGRAFSQVLAPLIDARFGDGFAGVEPQALYRAVNRVQPSFIRVEADEATYGLHIILRFELEQELIEGRLKVTELPEAWNARFKAYFGLDVPDDSQGVLQDVHWAMGAIGYFPTYALGNLIGGQLWERAHIDMPDLDDQLGAGELSGLREWLREHVHRYGSKFSMPELLEREVGGPIAVDPFVAYLKAKLGDVYGAEL
ncbi:MAG TPA: carboxypeptidase M32 [Solirubrobacteraceae bacterium]|nr:carboxypeptidase M32 [Solirubrobacteraceae bacterium]